MTKQQKQWRENFWKEINKYYPRAEYFPQIKDTYDELEKIIDEKDNEIEIIKEEIKRLQQINQSQAKYLHNYEVEVKNLKERIKELEEIKEILYETDLIRFRIINNQINEIKTLKELIKEMFSSNFIELDEPFNSELLKITSK